MSVRRFMKATLAATLFACATAIAQAQTPRDTIATLPDSQVLLYVNARRIMEEALPRVVPQQEFEKALADFQKGTSFDPRSIHFIAMGGRFREPFSTNNPPDFVLLVKGTFNADALLTLGRVAAEGQYTQETYKGRSLNLFKFEKKKNEPAGADQGQQKQSGAPTFPFPEIAVVALDANTLLAGVPNYVKAAIDAEGGQGRVRADLVDLIARNPDNLVSFGGDLPASMVESLKSMGMPPNAEIEKVVGSLRQMQFSVSMGANDFGAHSVVRTDTAESAKVLNGLLQMGLSLARAGIEGDLQKLPPSKVSERETLQAILNLVGSLKSATSENELQIDVTVPQATVADFVKTQLARAKAAEKKPAARKPVRRRGPRRRR